MDNRVLITLIVCITIVIVALIGMFVNKGK